MTALQALREIALVCPGECLDLAVWCPDIARVMERQVHADTEARGLVWIVGERNVTWGVSMPGSLASLRDLDG